MQFVAQQQHALALVILKNKIVEICKRNFITLTLLLVGYTPIFALPSVDISS